MLLLLCRVVDDRSCIGATGEQQPFQRMNNLAVRVLLDLTASMRFPGTLNVDLNEISTNLVPFPSVHYLLSSVSPLSTRGSSSSTRSVDQLFSDVFRPENHLLCADPRNDVFMACALLARGSSLKMSDIRRCVDANRSKLKFVPWNEDGWKIGHCAVAARRDLPHSVLSLSNSTGMSVPLKRYHNRFERLYSRKAHLHHYAEYMDVGVFDEARESVRSIIRSYEDVKATYYAGSPSTAGAQPRPRVHVVA